MSASGNGRRDRDARRGAVNVAAGRAWTESLEHRLLMAAAPTVSAFSQPPLSILPADGFTLGLSAPLDGSGARDGRSYRLTNRGPDGAAGGGDDFAVPLFPAYRDQGASVLLRRAADLRAWLSADYFLNLGLMGQWTPDADGAAVAQALDGGASFFVSDSAMGTGATFIARLRAVGPTAGDDAIGVVFNYRADPATGRPDQYYLLSWRRAAAGGAEAGLKLVRVSGTGASGQTPDLYDLENTDPRVRVLATSPAAAAWQPDVDYDVAVTAGDGGALHVAVTRAADGSVVWSAQATDASPLPAGKAGFYNFGQAQVRYAAADLAGAPIGDGRYELRGTAGAGALRGVDGLLLDGDADGTAGGDFARAFAIDGLRGAGDGVNLIADGGFETPALGATTPLATFGIGQSFGGWTVAAGNVDLIRTFWVSAAGAQSVDLSGTTAGTIYQDVQTLPGRRYVVTFSLAGLGGVGAATKRVEVRAGAQAVSTQAFVSTGGTAASMNWEPRSAVFTATGTTTRIAFRSLESNGAGPALDDVAVQLVQEASVLARVAPGSDTGASAADGVTSVRRPTFEVQTSAGGTIRVDLDGDGAADVVRQVADAGTYLIAAPADLADGAFPVGVSFTDAAGSVASTGVPLRVDTAAPTLAPPVTVAPSTVRVRFADAGVDPASAVDPARYVLVASGGDGVLGNGNDVNRDARVSSVTFDPLTQTATLTLSAPLPDDVYGLTAAGVRDLAGNVMAAASSASATLSTAPAAAASARLNAASDSGASNADGVTNVVRPSIDVTVNKPGRIAVDVDGNGTTDVSLLVSEPGTYTLASPVALADGLRTARATLTPASGVSASAETTFRVDTRGPRLLAGNPNEQAPLAARTIRFNEAIDGLGSAQLVAVMTGPGGSPIPLRSITGSGDTYTLTFDSQAAPGAYAITANTAMFDLAGNAIDQDNDGVNGEPGQDNPLDAWTLTADTTKPTILSVAPTGFTNQSLTEITVRFSEPILASSMTPARVAVTVPGGGLAPISAVVQLAPDLFRIDVPAQSADGAYTLGLDGLRITDLAGNELGVVPLFADFVTIDRTGAKVASSTPSGQVTGTVSSIVVEFDSDVAAATFSAADVTLTGPAGGTIAVTGVTALSARLFRVDFAAQSAPGSYALTVGPNVLDSAGNAMNQDGDATNGEATQDRYAGSFQIVPQEIALTLTKSSVGEADANPALRGIVTRAGSTALPLVVTLASSATGELTVPATVTIPAGAASAQFDVTVVRDGVVDGDKLVTITAAVQGATGQTRQVTVADADAPALSITLGGQQATEGGAVTATISRNAYVGQALTVALSQSNAVSSLAQFVLPPTVTIPAGQTSVTITLQTVNDALIERTKAVSITATAPAFLAASATVTVDDDDLPTLSLSVAPATFSEAAGAAAAVGTVTRAVVTDQPLTVKLSSGDTTEAGVPATVVIPAGQASATFALAAVNDALSDGTQSVVVSANGTYPECGCTILSGGATATVQVTDDEAPTLTVTLGRASAPEGSTFTATVTRGGNLSPAVLVALASSDPSEATVPPNVFIPAGAASVTFTVTATDDGLTDGRQNVTITATAAGYNAGSAALAVLDSNLPDLVVASVVAPPVVATDAFFNVSYRLENHGLTPATGSWQQQVFLSTDPLRGGGDDVFVGSFTFTGTLPPGQFFGRTIPVRAPLATGDRYLIVVEDVDDAVVESDEANNATASATVQVRAEYAATVTTDVNTALAGTTVAMRGHAALAADGSPAKFKLVNVHVGVRGTTRVISAITDAAGDFTLSFKPLPGEAGNYTIGATHPGVAAADVQDRFTLVGLAAEPPTMTLALTEQGRPATGQFTLRNLSQIDLTNVAVQVLGKPANMTVNLSLAGGVSNPTLAGDATLILAYTVSATTAATPTGTITLRVTTAQGATLDVPLSFTVAALTPRLTADPAALQVGALRGQQTLVEFLVTNHGGRDSGPLNLSLPAVPWIRAATPTTIASIAPGGSTRVMLQLTPPADLPLGDYTGQVVLNGGNGVSLNVPFSFRAISDATGGLTVDAQDEYTFFAEARPHVAGARVTVVDAVDGSVAATGVTSADGTVNFPSLPEGYYRLQVAADKHNSYAATILIAAGKTRTVQAFLPRNLVTYTWTVVPTETEDVTVVNIETTFETNVPAPVVTVDPPLIDLSSLDHVGATTQVNLTVTNHGLIAAQNGKFRVGGNGYYEVRPLTTDVGLIPAKSSIIVPVTIARLKGPALPAGAPAAAAGALAAAPPDDCPLVELGLEWGYFCGVYLPHLTVVSFSNTGGTCPTGGGGISLPGGDPGDGGPSDGTIYPPIFAESGANCDPCAQAIITGLLKCGWSLVPLTGLPACINDAFFCAYGANDSVQDFRKKGRIDDWRKIVDPAIDCLAAIGSCVKEIPGIGTIAKIWTCGRAAEDIWIACATDDAGAAGSPAAAAAAPGAAQAGTLGSFGDAAMRQFSAANTRLQAVSDAYAYILGSDNWFAGNDADSALLQLWLNAYSNALAPLSDGGRLISDAEAGALRATSHPSTVSAADVDRTIDRWNRTVAYWEGQVVYSYDLAPGANANFIALDTLTSKFDDARTAIAESQALGHANPLAELAVAKREALAALNGGSGVCARVKLQLSQNVVQTRDAFAATLELVNQQPTDLTNVSVTLTVRDASGNVVNHLFGIANPTLTNISAVDGTGAVLAGGTGTASWKIIPSLAASAATPQVYTVGGTMTYVDNGQTVTVDLADVAITVLPQPELYLKYFWQRDVVSDDPHTAEVEPSQPFELDVIVENRGHGAARSLRIDSAQPKIIENDKGLLIDFQIIASQVDGQNLTPSLTADFGTIAPGQVRQARWLMTSTLQGLFTEYSATFQHQGDIGGVQLSLVQGVEIHELIRAVRAYGPGADDRLDFVTNDVPDATATPDTIHFSNGATAPVAVFASAAVDAPASPAHLQVQLSVAAGAGWQYLRIADPADARFRLVKIVRSDGVELPAENYWRADRTFTGGGRRPTYENTLHLIDNASTGAYTLVYAPVDAAAPASAVAPLAPTTPVRQIPVAWGGQDDAGGTGVAAYDVYVSDNGAPFLPWQLNTTATSATYVGDRGHTYAFYSVARDAHGNVEPAPPAPDAATTVDGVPPVVTAAAYGGNTPIPVPGLKYVTVSFSEDVRASLGADDLIVRNVADGVGVNPTSFQYDQASNTAVLTFAFLPDGNYELTVVPDGIVDAAGNPLAPWAGLDFFELAGDLNRDRVVDAADRQAALAVLGTPGVGPGEGDANGDHVVDVRDLLLLGQNYNTTGTVLAQGDFNGDGVTDVIDLLILGQNYNRGGRADLDGDGTVTQADLDILDANFGHSIPEPAGPAAAPSTAPAAIPAAAPSAIPAAPAASAESLASSTAAPAPAPTPAATNAPARTPLISHPSNPTSPKPAAAAAAKPTAPTRPAPLAVAPAKTPAAAPTPKPGPSKTPAKTSPATPSKSNAPQSTPHTSTRPTFSAAKITAPAPATAARPTPTAKPIAPRPPTFSALKIASRTERSRLLD